MNDFFTNSSTSPSTNEHKSAFKRIPQTSKSISIDSYSTRSTPFQTGASFISKPGSNFRKVEQKSSLMPTKTKQTYGKCVIRSKSLNDLEKKCVAIKRATSLQKLNNYMGAKKSQNEKKCDTMKNRLDFQLTKIDLQFKISTYIKNNEAKSINKLQKYNVYKKDSLVSCSNTNTSLSLSLFRTHVKDEDAERLPCSNSLVDLLINMLRYKEISENLIDLLMPTELVKDNLKFFQAKFTCINNIYQVLFKLIEIYANNILALEVCATDKKNLETFFGKEVFFLSY